MSQEERLIQIKKLLKEKHHLSTRIIAQYFNVSFDTARRDVIHLTTTGQAIRVHGGVRQGVAGEAGQGKLRLSGVG